MGICTFASVLLASVLAGATHIVAPAWTNHNNIAGSQPMMTNFVAWATGVQAVAEHALPDDEAALRGSVAFSNAVANVAPPVDLSDYFTKEQSSTNATAKANAAISESPVVGGKIDSADYDGDRTNSYKWIYGGFQFSSGSTGLLKWHREDGFKIEFEDTGILLWPADGDQLMWHRGHDWYYLSLPLMDGTLAVVSQIEDATNGLVSAENPDFTNAVNTVVTNTSYMKAETDAKLAEKRGMADLSFEHLSPKEDMTKVVFTVSSSLSMLSGNYVYIAAVGAWIGDTGSSVRIVRLPSGEFWLTDDTEEVQSDHFSDVPFSGDLIHPSLGAVRFTVRRKTNATLALTEQIAAATNGIPAAISDATAYSVKSNATGEAQVRSIRFTDVNNIKAVVKDGSVDYTVFQKNGYSWSAFGGNAPGGFYSIALGSYASASSNYSTALGSYASASSNYSTALGDSASASRNYSTALGSYASASGNASIALGSYASASGNASIALGYNASATDNEAVTIGDWYDDTMGENYDSHGDNTLNFAPTDDPDKVFFRHKTLSEIIGAKAHAPGNYAAVSNAAMSAMHTMTNDVPRDIAAATNGLASALGSGLSYLRGDATVLDAVRAHNGLLANIRGETLPDGFTVDGWAVGFETLREAVDCVATSIPGDAVIRAKADFTVDGTENWASLGARRLTITGLTPGRGVVMTHVGRPENGIFAGASRLSGVLTNLTVSSAPATKIANVELVDVTWEGSLTGASPFGSEYRRIRMTDVDVDALGGKYALDIVQGSSEGDAFTRCTFRNFARSAVGFVYHRGNVVFEDCVFDGSSVDRPDTVGLVNFQGGDGPSLGDPVFRRCEFRGLKRTVAGKTVNGPAVADRVPDGKTVGTMTFDRCTFADTVAYVIAFGDAYGGASSTHIHFNVTGDGNYWTDWNAETGRGTKMRQFGSRFTGFGYLGDAPSVGSVDERPWEGDDATGSYGSIGRRTALSVQALAAPPSAPTTASIPGHPGVPVLPRYAPLSSVRLTQPLLLNADELVAGRLADDYGAMTNSAAFRSAVRTAAASMIRDAMKGLDGTVTAADLLNALKHIGE